MQTRKCLAALCLLGALPAVAIAKPIGGTTDGRLQAMAMLNRIIAVQLKDGTGIDDATLRKAIIPCPADPALAGACARLRRTSIALWCIALLCTTTGAVFAFLLPRLA